MKPLAIWVAVVGILLAVLAIASNSLRETKQVFVLVDSSFETTAVWDDVRDELHDIESRDNTEFALATEKEFVHSWSDRLLLGSVSPYAPCSFDSVAHAEVAEADERILITSSSSCDTSAFVDWTIVVLDP